VEPGKVTVTPTSVLIAMSSDGSGTTEVMVHSWRLVGDCSKHVHTYRVSAVWWQGE